MSTIPTVAEDIAYLQMHEPYARVCAHIIYLKEAEIASVKEAKTSDEILKIAGAITAYDDIELVMKAKETIARLPPSL